MNVVKVVTTTTYSLASWSNANALEYYRVARDRMAVPMLLFYDHDKVLSVQWSIF